jgi:DNA-binding SARP family transcriptional activator
VKSHERSINISFKFIMAHLTISLLGPFEAFLDGRPVTFDYVKVQALLAYLIVEADQPVQREKLATLLWPESSQQAAQSSLRQALTRLRTALGDHHADSPFIFAERDTLRFNANSDSKCDIKVFERLLAMCGSHQHNAVQSCSTCAGQLTQLYQLYRGHFLEWLRVPHSNAFEEWTQVIRERKRWQALEALGNLAEYHHRQGDYARMLEIAQRQVELEPFHESAHCQVVVALAASGRRSQAVAHFNDFSTSLLSELGLHPSSETLALLEKIKSGEI